MPCEVLETQILWSLNVDKDVIKNGCIPDKLWKAYQGNKNYDPLSDNGRWSMYLRRLLVLEYGTPSDDF